MFEDLNEPSVELVPRAPAPLSRKVQQLQDKVFDRATAVVDAAHAFGELDPANPDEVPEGWIEEFGEKEAKRRHRIARYALMSSKEAPVGLRMSQDTFSSIMKLKAAEKTGGNTLNVQMVFMPAADLSMERIKVDK